MKSSKSAYIIQRIDIAPVQEQSSRPYPSIAAPIVNHKKRTPSLCSPTPNVNACIQPMIVRSRLFVPERKNHVPPFQSFRPIQNVAVRLVPPPFAPSYFSVYQYSRQMQSAGAQHVRYSSKTPPVAPVDERVLLSPGSQHSKSSLVICQTAAPARLLSSGRRRPDSSILQRAHVQL